MFVLVVADCGRLEDPVNGSASATAGVSVFGDVDRPAVTSFACDVGFELVGPLKRLCLANGTWSGYQPVCECELYCIYNNYILLRVCMIVFW